MSALFHNQEVQLSLKNVIADLKCLSLNCQVDHRRERLMEVLKKTFLLSHPPSLVLYSGHTVFRRGLWPHWWAALRDLVS